MAQPKGAGKQGGAAPSELKNARMVIERVRAAERALKELDLEALRRCGGLSQERAAREADVSVKTWFRWEQGTSTPNVEAVERVCRYVAEHVVTRAAA